MTIQNGCRSYCHRRKYHKVHIYILGIGGTFMGSLAQLASASSYQVSGCDKNVYSPMLEQLEQANIKWKEGYDANQINDDIDLYVIGNNISRGNPLLEAILNRNLPYTSGPQLLCDYILREKWVLACAGTHGKTTTSSMLSWVLEYAGMKPGFLIGGVPSNFGYSATLGDSDFFVIEADEYDSAFFDKRSKFIHYRPRTLIVNNLEFDHADIFDDLAAIQRQCHHLIRTLPECALLITPEGVTAIEQVIEQGCYSERQLTSSTNDSAHWYAKALNNDSSHFDVYHLGTVVAQVNWQLTGEHNIANAIAVFAAAMHVGVKAEITAKALATFKGVKRRMELLRESVNDNRKIYFYDDFAHHPTAITTTLEGLRNKVDNAVIVALIEPRSNTMKMGVHQQQLLTSVATANIALWYQNARVDWAMSELLDQGNSSVRYHIDDIVENCKAYLKIYDSQDIYFVMMSNGNFDGIHQKLIDALTN